MPEEDLQPAATSRACPRCAYDLSGAVAAWPAETCPMRGLCTECGLEFEWADLFSAERRRISWLYEHARSWTRIDKAWITALRALTIVGLWRRLGVRHEVNPRRIVLLPLVSLSALFAVTTVVSVALLVAADSIPRKPGPLVARVFPLPGAGGSGARVTMASEQTVTFELGGRSTDLSVPEPGQLLFVQDPSMGGISLLHTTVNPDGSPSSFQRWLGTGQSYYVRRGLVPLQNTRFLVIVGAVPKSVLSSHFGLDLRELIQRGAWDPLFPHGLRRFVGALLVPFAFVIPACAVVLASPSEWRRAHVRPAHLTRLAIYSLAPSLALGVLHAAMQLATATTIAALLAGVIPIIHTPDWLQYDASDWFLVRDEPRWSLLLMLFWGPIYWWFGLRRGVSLQRIWALWAFASFAGALGVLIAAVAPGAAHAY